MENTIHVRSAAAGEADLVAPLFDAYRVFYGEESDLERARNFLRTRLARDESVVLLAFADETLAGFAQCYPSFSSVSTAPILILNDLFVSEDFRHRGVGTKLLHASEELARARGAVRVSLTTAHTNSAAQALYESYGFTLDTVFRAYHLRVIP